MAEPILSVEEVSKVYPGRHGMLGERSPDVHALKGVSLSIARGESFGLVGESGSGKTTLTRAILRLEKSTSGVIALRGATSRRSRRAPCARCGHDCRSCSRIPMPR